MKYTYKDIIIDPNDKRVKIREKYYMGGTPNGVLEKANKANEILTDILLDIDDKDDFPFIGISSHGYYCCLIKPKESQVKYVPFDLSKKEDREALRDKWTKHKYLKTELKITNFEIQDGTWYANGRGGGILFRNYTFLDGSPVGRKVED